MIHWALLLVFSAFTTEVGASATNSSTHSFNFVSIEGNPLPMASFKGKAVLVVNTASYCGFTKQYEALQELWEHYKARGLIVLGVPSNDFGQQEPGKEEEIKRFCEVNYGIDFPMTSKVKVSGQNAHPFYRWAATRFGPQAKPRWNFHKYLITPDGDLIDWFSTVTNPTSPRILKAIEQILPRSK
jgi:glutathione peroxidase